MHLTLPIITLHEHRRSTKMSEWQTKPSKSAPKRAFVGNLNNDSNIEEKVRDLLSKSARHQCKMLKLFLSNNQTQNATRYCNVMLEWPSND